MDVRISRKTSGDPMSIELITPTTLPTATTHHQLSIATGSKLIFIAGQVALDASGNRVGDGDLAAQVEQCYENVGAALAAAGATFADVAKFTVYATDLSPAALQAFGAGLRRACERLQIPQPMAPLTGIGVVALAEPEFQVEIEAIAVLNN
jgi:enamine deaminase RidA (YjgF/YER057c/UK114 family)